MPKAYIKSLIKLQKIAARKSIALQNVKISKTNSHEQYSLFRVIADERKFLASNFNDVTDVHDLMDVVHGIRHNTISRAKGSIKCRFCKEILAEMAIELPGAPAQYEAQPDKEDELKPRFGNLIAVLQQEVQNENEKMERRRMPSQNDLTRWALKNAVLEFYQNLEEKDNVVVVDDLYDDRLSTALAPDFDVIYEMWMKKLDELQRRDDKYTLNSEEYDKAEDDMRDGMRGSAFEKQLDRYREDFMQKLKR